MPESKTNISIPYISSEQPRDKREIGYRGFYLERSGESAAALVDQLIQEPEMPLDDHEKQVVYEFERSLSECQLANGMTIETLIRATKSEDATAPQLFPEFILNHTVDTPGLEIPQLESHDDVYHWFSEAARSKSVPTEQLREIITETGKSYRSYMEQVLLDEREPDDKVEVSTPLVLNPQEVLDVGLGLSEARHVLLSLRGAHHEGGEKVEGAQRAIIEVYLAKINALVAARIPIADYLHTQSLEIGDETTAKSANELIPSGLRRAIETPELRERLFTRLDYLRNGMGQNTSGKASAVMAESAYGAEPSVETDPTSIPRFTPEQAAYLKETRLSVDEVIQFFERVIDRADLLSNEDPVTWSSARRVRAADERFQVVKNPSKGIFGVDGVSGVYKVPSKGSSLYNLLVVGGFHELQHITQAQADRELGKTLRIAGAMKGKRPTMIREGGANASEREAEMRLFGKAKPIALTYARALQTLENGGNLREATRAFYQEKMRAMPETNPTDAATQAADRVLRLVRGGGRESQPMAYAEEGILSQELTHASSEARIRAMAVTSLDFVDQVRLHRYDLLPKITTSIDWNDHIMAEFMKLLPSDLFPTTE
ncbi:hypothetical protein D3C73_103400 [compost metagenome]